LAYATAIDAGEAAINQCPPGGEAGVARLATITGQPHQPLNPENGYEGPLTVAIIDEDWCIGCTLCIKACPVDAIIGTNKAMHTVIESVCTGCELCIPACPVDCISLDSVSGERTGWDAWTQQQADEALQRYTARAQRLARGRSDNLACAFAASRASFSAASRARRSARAM
jgi:electron transport complex protein RnfB